MDVDYFEHEVEPLLGPGAEFVGELNERQKPSFFASAAATLFPSDWPEPFGLVMIESLAAGTPVIALRRGAVPEVLVDGVTGFICDDVDQMTAAVGRLHEIDRAACRARATEFSAHAMCSGYEAVYRSLVTSADERPARCPGGRPMMVWLARRIVISLLIPYLWRWWRGRGSTVSAPQPQTARWRRADPL